jgi:CheY-like chemotaxis protein
MKLLIVEDNSRMRQMIRSVVADLAEEVHECEDGSGAPAAYAEYQPDWVLMDIKMREVDGLAATRQIRASAPTAKIMIVTNYDGADLRAAAQRAGASQYVVKEDLLAIRGILLGEH